VGSFAPNENAQMAQYLRIRCVVKTDRTSAHERIDSVGGVKPDGTRWKLTQDKAISYIEDGTYVFYIEKPGGHRVDVIVATNAYGSYLKTVSDKEQPSKLLSLPTCPEI
jgi:Protein of unknown function (DUF3892)